MSLSVELEAKGSAPYYYRFTCEDCGCKSHWLAREIVLYRRAEYRGTYNETEAMAQLHAEAARAVSDTKTRIRRELDECLAGKRMLVEPEQGGVLNYLDGTCRRCGHVQSWAPRLAPGLMKRKQEKAAAAFNATPVLSAPELVLDGPAPGPEEPDLAAPCQIVIEGSCFGIVPGSPVYLNGKKVGETVGNTISVSCETSYRDNLIQVSDLAVYTYYVEAAAGGLLRFEYKNFGLRRA